MTRDQAIRRLRKQLGPSAYANIHTGISSPERRERYRVRRQSAKVLLAGAYDALKARRDALLAADTEYQALLAIHAQARKNAEDVRYHDGESGYKFEVGTRDGIFRRPLAEGDTWEDVFAILQKTP